MDEVHRILDIIYFVAGWWTDNLLDMAGAFIIPQRVNPPRVGLLMHYPTFRDHREPPHGQDRLEGAGEVEVVEEQIAGVEGKKVDGVKEDIDEHNLREMDDAIFSHQLFNNELQDDDKTAPLLDCALSALPARPRVRKRDPTPPPSPYLSAEDPSVRDFDFVSDNEDRICKERRPSGVNKQEEEERERFHLEAQARMNELKSRRQASWRTRGISSGRGSLEPYPGITRVPWVVMSTNDEKEAPRNEAGPSGERDVRREAPMEDIYPESPPEPQRPLGYDPKFGEGRRQRSFPIVPNDIQSSARGDGGTFGPGAAEQRTRRQRPSLGTRAMAGGSVSVSSEYRSDSFPPISEREKDSRDGQRSTRAAATRVSPLGIHGKVKQDEDDWEVVTEADDTPSDHHAPQQARNSGVLGMMTRFTRLRKPHGGD